MHMKGTVIVSFIIVLPFFGSPVVHGCVTPFGNIARRMHIRNCDPIIELIRRYGKDMPPLARSFIVGSLLSNDGTTVCCSQDVNIDRALKSVGREILRNFDDYCGDNKFKRVSFGEESTFMSHPWSALLVYDAYEPFQCGGTLITNRYILTAAHCIRSKTLIGVRLREHNTSSELDCALDMGGFEHCYDPVLELGIDKSIIHPKYSHVTNANDIALIRLDRIVDMDRAVRPICLPPLQNYDFNSKFGEIIGWGVTQNGTASNTLLRADVPIHALDHCRQFYRKKVFDDTQMCVAGDNATSTCRGDSGGPLVVRYEDEFTLTAKYFQIAIISSGGGICGDDGNFPSVALRLSAYRDWIADTIEL